MPTFVHVSEGDDAATAQDLLVIEEPALVRAIGHLIARRLGAVDPRVSPLRPLPSDVGEKRER
jgi:hypothetical protein